MAEDIDLASELDALEAFKGPQAFTCQWWATASDRDRDAVKRNVVTKSYTAVTKFMRSKGIRVTAPGIRDHAAGTCDRCQTSQKG